MSALQQYKPPGPAIPFTTTGMDTPWRCMGLIDPHGVLARHFLLACIGSPVPPNERSIVRNQLDTRVRGPWSSDINMEYVEMPPIRDRTCSRSPLGHYVEIDRMPPPWERVSTEEYGPEGLGRMAATPTRRTHSNPEAEVDSPWEMHSPNNNRSRDVYPRTRRLTPMDNPSILNRMVEVSRPERQD